MLKGRLMKLQGETDKSTNSWRRQHFSIGNRHQWVCCASQEYWLLEKNLKQKEVINS